MVSSSAASDVYKRQVMDYTHGNQSQAAGILGINRGTLRKKLRTYSLIQ